ncbi:MAG: gamma-glutamyltranspeptidase [Zetaproteobacteria bacterium]|nr:MAG: gamma-glutamyltranspeptidase [Zetaproteobacteria bacterium]
MSRIGRIKNGVIAAGHPHTVEAGAALLSGGGNAVDAAIAAVCTAFVAEPVLTAAGGGGFMLIAPASGEASLLDGFARMPRGHAEHKELIPIEIDFGDHCQTFHCGQASVASPSLLAMLFEAHARYGRLPMREVLTPAIEAARQGIRLNALQASFIRLLTPILTRLPDCARLHTRNQQPCATGDIFRNPDLANTLEMLAIDGIEEMYRGDLARAIVRACSPHGLLTLDDLAAPQFHWRKPLRVRTHSGLLLTNPPPSSGGLLIALTLSLLEHLPERHDWRVMLAETLRAVSQLRITLLDRAIRQNGIAATVLKGEVFAATLASIEQRLFQTGKPDAESENAHGGTTHISVVDGQGMAVSITTSNGEGSGIIVPGSGIHLNNMLGEEDINPLGFHALPPGYALSSMMAPSIFQSHRHGRLVLGSGGSNRLRSAIGQVLLHILTRGKSLSEAIHAPRMHNEGATLDVEPHLLDAHSRTQLKALGWQLREWRSQGVYFGGVHAIHLTPNGSIEGCGDPRRGGSWCLA